MNKPTVTLRCSPEESIDCRESFADGHYSFIISAKEPTVLEQFTASFSFDFQKNDVFFANGYQSWTYCPERGIGERFRRAMKYCPPIMDEKYGFSKYGDAHFCDFKDGRGLAHGYTYAYVRRGKQWFLFASLAEKTGFTRIILNASAHTILFEKDCAGRVLKPGESYTVFDLIFPSGKEDEVFDLWFEKLGVKPLTNEKVTGYTSWYNCYQNITEERIRADLKGMSSLPVKPDIFQVDDGYETYVGDWLDVDQKKFPHGMQPIASSIIENGYRAGIWLAPFVCEKNSRLFTERPGWLLRDDAGQPVFCGANWSGAYALNIRLQEVRDYIAASIEAYKDMGFTLFKLDFLYAACMLSIAEMTRGEQIEDAVNLLREACGDAAIIGCGVPLCAAFGKMEYCRIGPDVSLSYDDVPYMRFFHFERPSTRHTVMNTLFRRQLSGRAFLNDPDVFILREDNTTLTPEQKDMLSTVNGLCGGVLFSSDECGAYSEEQKTRYREVCALRNAKLLSVEKEKYRLIIGYISDGNLTKKSFAI